MHISKCEGIAFGYEIVNVVFQVVFLIPILLFYNLFSLFWLEFYGKNDYRNDKWDDEVYSAENLRCYKLDPKQPTCSALYYYTLRNNVVHSGKMMPQEINMVLNALLGLTEIFCHSINKLKGKNIKPEKI